MDIKTEKTFTVAFSESELNYLRCFLDDALSGGVWEEFEGPGLNFVVDFYRAAVKATTGVTL